MSHAQKPDFVFRRNGRVHLNRRGFQFSRLLADELFVSAVVKLDATCSEVLWRVLDTHSIRQFPLHFHSRASPCAIMFQLESNTQKGIISTSCTASYMTQGRVEYDSTVPRVKDEGLDLWKARKRHTNKSIMSKVSVYIWIKYCQFKVDIFLHINYLRATL
jgi:hypothetical protein